MFREEAFPKRSENLKTNPPSRDWMEVGEGRNSCFSECSEHRGREEIKKSGWLTRNVEG